MKKIKITLFFVAFTTIIYAQNVHFGITAGPNLGKVKPSNADSEKPTAVVGFQFGVFAELQLANKMSLQPELQYITLGYKFDPSDDEYGIRIKSNHILLPVLVKYGATEKLKIGVGPFVSAKLLTQYKFLPYTEGDGDAQEEDLFEYTDADNDEFKTLGVGVAVDINYQLLPKFGVNLRYNHGMSNIFKVEATDGSKVYHRFFTLGLNYRIR